MFVDGPVVSPMKVPGQEMEETIHWDFVHIPGACSPSVCKAMCALFYGETQERVEGGEKSLSVHTVGIPVQADKGYEIRDRRSARKFIVVLPDGGYHLPKLRDQHSDMYMDPPFPVGETCLDRIIKANQESIRCLHGKLKNPVKGV